MSDDDTSRPDLLAIIDELEPLREAVRGMVAAFVADGFTDPQARDLVVLTLKQSQANQ